MNKIFKSWLLEASKAIPLVVAIFIVTIRDFITGIGFFIITLYLANLYDLKWQSKLFTLQKDSEVQK